MGHGKIYTTIVLASASDAEVQRVLAKNEEKAERRSFHGAKTAVNRAQDKLRGS
jgi:hypothetical protein